MENAATQRGPGGPDKKGAERGNRARAVGGRITDNSYICLPVNLTFRQG